MSKYASDYTWEFNKREMNPKLKAEYCQENQNKQKTHKR